MFIYKYESVYSRLVHDLNVLNCSLQVASLYCFRTCGHKFVCFSGLAVPWSEGPSLPLLALRWVGRFTCRHRTGHCCHWTKSPRESVKSWWWTLWARKQGSKEEKRKQAVREDPEVQRSSGFIWAVNPRCVSRMKVKWHVNSCLVLLEEETTTKWTVPDWNTCCILMSLYYFLIHGGKFQIWWIYLPFISVLLSVCSKSVSTHFNTLALTEIKMATTSQRPPAVQKCRSCHLVLYMTSSIQVKLNEWMNDKKWMLENSLVW